jgi:hypothetical protein
MDNSNEQFNTNMEPPKSDVLRARDIIPGSPPYGNIAGQEENLQETSHNDPYPPAVPKKPVEANQKTSEIPKFNLAEEIMAEHRRITAIRRKGPGEKDEAQKQERASEPAGDTTGQPKPALSEQKQIIAEIVARDIESLCKGDTRSGQKQEFKGQE